jgi:RNA polymerase sigma-70 factor (ECF subfamily)
VGDKEKVMDPSAEAKFTRIYGQHYAAVIAYCGRRVGRAEAEDITSAVFTVVWRRIDEVDTAAALPWLYGVAYRTLGTDMRARRRRLRLDHRIRGLAPDPVRRPDEILVQREEDRRVIELLRSMRPSDQEILRLAAWEGLDSGDIALVLGCSVNAAQQRLSRAKKRFGSRLSNAPDRSITTDLSTMEGGSI